jgi:hypothetical protein
MHRQLLNLHALSLAHVARDVAAIIRSVSVRGKTGLTCASVANACSPWSLARTWGEPTQRHISTENGNIRNR